MSADVSTLAGRQVEPSATSNPANRNVVLAAYADSVTDVVPGVSKSTDRGTCWSPPSGSGPLLPNPPGLTWGSRSAAGQVAGGDPSIAWGLGSTVYYGTLGFQNNAAPPAAGVCNVGGLYVYKSVDRGETWSPPSAAVVANTQTVFRDKGYVAVDSNPASPHAGIAYITWDDDEYTGCPQNFATNFSVRRIMFSRSSDGGMTWSAPTTLAGGTALSSCLLAPVPVVGVDGAVYVVWFDCNSGDRELVRKSTNGGGSFSGAVVAGSGTLSPRAGVSACSNPLPNAKFRVNSPFPMIATDPTSASRVYVSWFGCPNDASGHPNAYFSASQDGGATWSPSPLAINDDVGLGHDHFFPWMAVDDKGVIRIMFGDDRLDSSYPTSYLYDIFIAESTNHGAAFGPSTRATTQSSNPCDDGFPSGDPNKCTFIGDYFGMASCGTPVWTDTRNLNEDIYASALPDCVASVGGISEAPNVPLPAAATPWTEGRALYLLSAGALVIFLAIVVSSRAKRGGSRRRA